jgi:hypothetical protein
MSDFMLTILSGRHVLSQRFLDTFLNCTDTYRQEKIYQSVIVSNKYIICQLTVQGGK